MAKILECVPNISEGTDQKKIERIVEEITAVENVKLIDYSSDRDHNRTVITFLGEPDAVLEAAYKMTLKACELIDMRTHHGGHPRMGAVDVMPLIPVSDISIEEAVEMSKLLAEKIAKDAQIHVTLYEQSATAPHRENLADIRRGQYEGMPEKIKQPEWIPDYGPAEFNPKSGVLALGVRPPLVAYNINLATANADIAKEIANVIRFAKGGYRYCKAMGLYIEETGKAQVSMNLVNPDYTTIFRVFETVKSEAEARGTYVTDSEIVGLVPLKNIVDSAKFYLKMKDFDMSQILEQNL